MPDLAEVALGLRALAFAATPRDVGVTPLASGVWGALMEFAAEQTWVSLVAILDGTTSLYFGSGGGIIGAGKSETVRAANRRFLEITGQHAGAFRKVDSYPTPPPGRARFYALMTDGVYASDEVEEAALRTPGAELLPLYAAAQDVITQIRLAHGKT